MEYPVPETIKLVDHSLSRVVRKGFMGMIEVSGDPEPGIFNVQG
jgi:nitrite reductase (NO-forming)